MFITLGKIKSIFLIGIAIFTVGSPLATAGNSQNKDSIKLVRYGLFGEEKPGIVDAENNIRDISALVDDITPLTIASGRLNNINLVNIDKFPLVPKGQRLGTPVNGVGKIIAVGFNYIDHIKETGQKVPKEPIVFMKSTTSIIGPNDDIMIPKNATMVDWEVELAIVIGKTARYVEEVDAAEYILGYTIGNDVSERAWQIYREGQFVKGKSADTFAPIGPYISLRDNIETSDLHIWLDVNGKRQQDSNTKNLIFSPEYLVSYLSSFMTLEPGDIVLTGTPGGIGGFQKPPRFLKPGDVVRLGISGLGEQQQMIVPFTPESK